MRRIVIVIASTISGLVLLFSYHTSTNRAGTTAAATGGAQPGVVPSAPDPSSPSSPLPNGGPSGSDRVVNGAPVSIEWGIVQVQITVRNGKIIQARTLQAPDENGHSLFVNQEALPVLDREAVSAQSARIDAVSGASETSQGYAQSLQSAIDTAHLS